MEARYVLTNQRIKSSEKTEEWHKGHILAFVQNLVSHSDLKRREKQMLLYRKARCLNLTDKQEILKREAITKPYGISLGIDWIDYPLIESKLEQLVGEFMMREIKKKCYVLNRRAKIEKLDQQFEMIVEEIMRELTQEVSEQLGFQPETANPDMQLPENIEEFFESDFKTESEEISDIILDLVLKSKKNIDVLKNIFFKFLIMDECIAEVEEEEGHPRIKHRDLFSTHFDWHPEKEIQADPQYIVYEKFLNINEILNEFELTKNQEKEIVSLFEQISLDFTSVDSLSDGFDNGRTNNFQHWIDRRGSALYLRCVEMKWISYKKVRVQVSQNKVTGKDIYHLIDEERKTKKTDDVKDIWIKEKRFCIMIGPNFVLDYGTINERNTKIDDVKFDKLLAVGLRRNNDVIRTDEVRSAAAKLEQLQDFASEILFEIRLMMRRNNGKVMVYDSAQIPKQFLKTGGQHAYQNGINRIMHHAKKDQFILINSKDSSSRYNFNQFTSVDMSTAKAFQELFNGLAVIEDLASKFLGVTPQREGMVQNYETASGVERAVTQSTARTEIYFSPFETFLQHLMENVILKAKHVYQEGELIDYVLGDLKSKFFKVFPNFLRDDIGVYFGNSAKEQKQKQIIDQAAQIALGNAQTPDLILELVEVLQADFASEAKKILKRAVNVMNEQRQQELEALQAQEAEKQKGETERKQMDDNLKREGYQKDLDVAEIYANNKALTERERNDTNKIIKAADIEANFYKQQNESKNKSKK